MKRAAKVFLIAVVAIGIILGGIFWFVDATLGSGMCKTTTYAETTSADGIIARVQMRDCGATTGYSRIVMLERSGFWTDQCRALALDGQPNVRITWAGSDLHIVHDAPGSDIFAQGRTCFGHAIKVSQER